MSKSQTTDGTYTPFILSVGTLPGPRPSGAAREQIQGDRTMNVLTVANFNKMRADNPGASPADLYDIACVRLSMLSSWATAGWYPCSIWLDNFANAPTSYKVH